MSRSCQAKFSRQAYARHWASDLLRRLPDVPEHVVQRLERLLTHPGASNAQRARFLDMSPHKFGTRMAVDRKFRTLVYIKRSPVAINRLTFGAWSTAWHHVQWCSTFTKLGMASVPNKHDFRITFPRYGNCALRFMPLDDRQAVLERTSGMLRTDVLIDEAQTLATLSCHTCSSDSCVRRAACQLSF